MVNSNSINNEETNTEMNMRELEQINTNLRQRNYPNNANKEIKTPGWISIDKL